MEKAVDVDVDCWQGEEGVVDGDAVMMELSLGDAFTTTRRAVVCDSAITFCRFCKHKENKRM